MPVTDVQTDTDALTLTVTAEFAAPVDRVWQIWADPRQLERWWGPPGYPATFVQHDFVPGGRATYFMTTPEGDRYYGWWEFDAIDGPTGLSLVDGFGDDTGTPNPEMPTGLMAVTLEAEGERTRMTVTSTSPSLEALEQVLAMGQAEGMREAMNQVDAILTEG